MPVSGPAAGILGAASGINAMLKGQIQFQMIRQQREMQQAQLDQSGQELALNRQRLADTQRQQKDALAAEAQQLAETIRHNRAMEVNTVSGQAAGITEAGIRANNQPGNVTTPAEARKSLLEQRTAQLKAIDDNADSYAYDPTTGKANGLKPDAARARAKIEASLQDDVLNRDAQALITGQAVKPDTTTAGAQPASQGTPDVQALYQQTVTIGQAAKKLEQAGISGDEVIRELQDPATRSEIGKRLKLDENGLGTLEGYFKKKAGGVQ